MTQPRRGLGRGLDALFSGGVTVVEPAAATVAEPLVPALAAAPSAPAGRRGSPEEIDIDLIAPNPDQPRVRFDGVQLGELIESIQQHGIIQPLIVTRDPEGGFRLIAGERRLQAAKAAGFRTVPVVFRAAADDDMLELALVENIQRADLNAIEEAMAYRRLTDEHGLTQEETARRVGKSRVTIGNSLRLLALENEIRSSVANGEISEGHARALLGLPEGRGRLNAWRDVVKKRLSVRDTEAFVRRTLAADAPSRPGAAPAGAQTAHRDMEYKDMETRLRRALGTRVTVTPQRSGPRITIDCYGDEEFHGVVTQILGTTEEDES